MYSAGFPLSQRFAITEGSDWQHQLALGSSHQRISRSSKPDVKQGAQEGSGPKHRRAGVYALGRSGPSPEREKGRVLVEQPIRLYEQRGTSELGRGRGNSPSHPTMHGNSQNTPSPKDFRETWGTVLFQGVIAKIFTCSFLEQTIFQFRG